MKIKSASSGMVTKIISILVALSLVVTLTPHLSSSSVANAEESQAQTYSNNDLGITDESVQGRVKSIDEITEALNHGGLVNVVDKSDVRFNVSDNSEDSALLASELPTKVDLRTTNKVTSVKNQNKTGTCWAWAANAAAETSIANATGKKAVDLSAFQTAYLAYEKLPTSTSSLTGSEISQKGEGAYIQNEKKSDDATDKGTNRLNGGGNSITASSMFMQGIGITTASDIAFPTYALEGKVLKTADILTFSQRKHTIARLSKQNSLGSLIETNATTKPEKYLSTNKDVLTNIKSALNDGNAVQISYWGGPSTKDQPELKTFYNEKTASQYTVQPSNTFLSSNHAVCVVGYDDTYSKTNFNSDHQPSGNGAFIVKNSWGTDWGDNGYFYLSYYDQSINEAFTYEFDTTNYSGSLIDTTTEIVDQYDYMQALLMSYAEVEWYSNIYTASQKQQLHHIGTYFVPRGLVLRYRVYKLKSNATTPKDIVADSFGSPDAEGSTTSDYEGYVSIKLKTPVTLEKGEKYAIWITQGTRTGGYLAPAPCQMNGVGAIASTAVINSGESFMSNDPENSWEALSAEDTALVSRDNFCIKGYATVLPDTMHRLYNQWTGEHFYTASDNEKANLVGVGWTDEGVGWTAPSSSNTPVYRLYNPYVKGGDHHYTTSASERDTLVKAGWKSEGIGWYSDDNKAVPVYRQYNPFAITGTHNYTTNKSENDYLVTQKWNAEGIGWYGIKTS